MYLEPDEIAALTGKEDFKTFCREYFDTFEEGGVFYHNTTLEKLNKRIAYDFYDEYVHSDRSLDQYKQETSSNE